ncbi:hypothetical protein BDZ97DRAFT_1857384 [Flammula alnicola]|nr:hypothetical protein BDZ97DRAFT_1857384 [Flammula alnicola]
MRRRSSCHPFLPPCSAGWTPHTSARRTTSRRRNAWIYEIPLCAVHLRESLNAITPDQLFPPDLLAKFDALVTASCLKLWMLELIPPLASRRSG